MPRENEDTHNDILKSFIGDDEDQEQLGGLNEPDVGDDDDGYDDVDDQPDQRRSDVDSGDDDGDEETQPRPRQQAQDDDEDGKQDRFSFKEDRAGNFVDRDGKIIIRAGKQRDLFVKLKKRWLAEEKKNKQITNRFVETVQAAQQLLQRYKEVKAQKSYFDDKGLTEPEIRQAADMAILMKVDPKAGVRKLLTMLHMNGTDLKDIGVTGPVDAAEVARIIEQRSQPKQKSDDELAREEAQSFLSRHPAARQYTGIVAQAKRRFPHMSFDEIWFQLVLHARERGSKGAKGGQRQGGKTPTQIQPRNAVREDGQKQRLQGRKLSLAAVDPSQSFSQIGRDLLRDLKELEGR